MHVMIEEGFDILDIADFIIDNKHSIIDNKFKS